MRNMSIVKSAIALGLTALIAACGGGGGSDSATTATATPATPVAGALAKYIGTYQYCDADYTMFTGVLADAGSDRLSLVTTEMTYENANCTGAVIASASWQYGSTISYLGTSTVTVSGGGLPASLEVDRINITTAANPLTLVGSAVTGNCVTYPNGSFCYDTVVAAQNEDAGLYATGNLLYDLMLSNGVYYADAAFTKQ